jgi:hypothetical protein
MVGKPSAILAGIVNSFMVTSDELPPTNEMPGKPRRKGGSVISLSLASRAYFFGLPLSTSFRMKSRMASLMFFP